MSCRGTIALLHPRLRAKKVVVPKAPEPLEGFVGPDQQDVALLPLRMTSFGEERRDVLECF
jgi:hypothetical protein